MVLGKFVYKDRINGSLGSEESMQFDFLCLRENWLQPLTTQREKALSEKQFKPQ